MPELAAVPANQKYLEVLEQDQTLRLNQAIPWDCFLQTKPSSNNNCSLMVGMYDNQADWEVAARWGG